MNVVGHQTPGPDLDFGGPAFAAEQIAVKDVILVVEKCLLSTVATLGHVMRDAGNDDAGKTGHARNLPPCGGFVPRK